MMGCDDVLPLLRDYADRELPAARAEVIERHVADCPSCAGRLAAERDLKLALRNRVTVGPAPAGLASSIARQVRSIATGPLTPVRPRHRHALILTAVMAIGFAGGAFGLWAWLQAFQEAERSHEASRLSAELVDDHIRYVASAVPGDWNVMDREEAETWFSSKLDVAVVLPAFDTQEMTLRGARLCYVLDRRVALLRYEREGQQLSLFAMSDRGLDFIGMDLVDVADAECAIQDYKGYRLVCWKQAGLLYALVAEQRHDGLLDLVRSAYQP